MTSEASSPAARPPSGRPWRLIALVFVLLWFVYLAVVRPGRGLHDLDAPGPGTQVDYAWSLRDLNGGVVQFADFQGKTLFVNIWATWCPPCVSEMPSIARLAATPELQDQVAFLCIATDDELEDVSRFTRAKNWPMTILHAQALPPVFLTEGIPATFFVTADGRVDYQRLGAAEWDAPAVVKKLQQLAAAPAK